LDYTNLDANINKHVDAENSINTYRPVKKPVQITYVHTDKTT